MTQHKRPHSLVSHPAYLILLQGSFLFCSRFFMAQQSFAQPSGADQDMFTYRVQANDTLIDLAQRYTLEEDNGQILQSLNDVADPKRLPIGKTLVIPFSLIQIGRASCRERVSISVVDG